MIAGVQVLATAFVNYLHDTLLQTESPSRICLSLKSLSVASQRREWWSVTTSNLLPKMYGLSYERPLQQEGPVFLEWNSLLQTC